MKLEDAKILIGDDSILARKQLKDVLTTFGGKHFFEAAIEKFKAEKPDIVFLDIVMPQKDGISAVSEICRIDPNAYIIIVSSVGTQTQLRNAIEAGARDFIQKPLNTDQIKSILSVKFEGR